MEVKKVVLIEPRKNRLHIIGVGLPLLGAILKRCGYQVDIFIGTKIELPMKILLDADLVGISILTDICYEGYRISEYLRSRGKKVVMGGVHASLLPEEALEYADYVVRGEAEYTFPALVEAIREDRLPEDIPGVSYWHNQTIRHNESNSEWTDLSALPPPDFSLVRNVQRATHKVQYSLETARGCPYNCTFCAGNFVFGKRLRQKGIEQTLQEISLYKDYNISFADNFFGGDKRHTKKLLQEMIDGKSLPRSIKVTPRLEIAWDDELMELIRLSNIKLLSLGFESINSDTLKDYNKQITVEDIKECIRRVQYYGLSIFGLFVFGGDGDTVETFDDTVEFCRKYRIEAVNFTILTPYVGTPKYTQLEAEGRLLTKNWELYDMHNNVVFQPKHMTPRQLREGYFRANQKFYSSPSPFVGSGL